MRESLYFHFTMGPVQGFVAQARRSKDLWSGSFLLSWLSGVAMHVVDSQKPENAIEFPIPEQDFIDAISDVERRQGPLQGGVPNRFKGLVAKVDGEFPAAEVSKAVRAAWVALANQVWEKDLAPYLETRSQEQMNRTKTVWDRQVLGFWEMSWALTQSKGVSNLIDRRKNWRNHMPDPEPGFKCMMMAGWQELSGCNRHSQVKAFWSDFRDHLEQQGFHGYTDLEEGEQLSALAFIKRRFAYNFNKLSLKEGAWPNITAESLKLPNISGWQICKKVDEAEKDDPTRVPSLAYLSAIPQLRQLLKTCKTDEQIMLAKQFVKSASRVWGQPSRWVKLKSLQALSRQNSDLTSLTYLDGQCFYPDSLYATQYSLDKGQQQYYQQQAQQVGAEYRDLCQSMGLEVASPYYALLLMDGDSLGSQMSDASKQASISGALNLFTRGVPEIVQQYDGFLIYAGGDDVLAFMPTDTVIECAYQLHEFYGRCFAEQETIVQSTLSGAIQFAHFKTPLMAIVSQAHHLLDDIAKDKTGRDSLAIRINKPGGEHAEWAMPWNEVVCNGKNNLIEAAQLLVGNSQQFTNGLLFKLHQVLQNHGQLADPEVLKHLAVAEFVHSGESLQMPKQQRTLDVAESMVTKLLLVARHVRRIVDENGIYKCTDFSKEPDPQEPHYQTDTMLLVRFLALHAFRFAKPMEQAKEGTS